MTFFKKTAVASIFATLSLAAVTNAQAAPISGTFALQIWNANTPGDDSYSSAQQGTATNAMVQSPNDLVYTGSYTGVINFNDPIGGPETIAGFLATAGGTLTSTGNNNAVTNTHRLSYLTLTSPNYQTASLFEFTFNTGSNTNFTVSHDDGFSIWNQSNTSEIISGYESPTVEVDSTFTLAANTTYNLWYSEANGLPADLIVNGSSPSRVPEPATLALLGVGLIGTSAVARRRRALAANKPAC